MAKATKKAICLHPDAPIGCSGQVIRAHTISRANSLAKIAVDGHVQAFNMGLTDFWAKAPFGGRLVGLRQASTFTGFCSTHDAELFRPLDIEPFAFTLEQVTLILYRMTCFELYWKTATLNLSDMYSQLDRGRSPELQREIQEGTLSFLAGTRKAATELLTFKQAIGLAMKSTRFENLLFRGFSVAGTPEVACCALLNPEFDFAGKQLQDLTSQKPSSWLGFAVFPTDAGGVVLFATLDSPSSASGQLVTSVDLLPDPDIANSVVRFAFEMSSNTFANPVWWQALPPADRQALAHRMMTGGVPVRSPTCLLDDGLRTVDWRIVRRAASRS